MKDYVYTLVLIDRLFKEESWTVKDEAIVSRHFKHLVDLEKEGILIMAGKTDDLNPNTKGFVFFTAETLQKAKNIMEKDPAIMEGIMSGTLQEFNLALFNNKYVKKNLLLWRFFLITIYFTFTYITIFKKI